MATLIRGTVCTTAWMILFAVAGLEVAILLNAIAPGYYPSVFPFANWKGRAYYYGEEYGIAQGAALGFMAGVLVAANLAWLRQLRIRPVLRSLGIVGILAIACGVAGGLIGWAIGANSPDQDRVLLPGGRNLIYDPIDVGIGMGASQGIILGSIVGTSVAIGLAWRRFRRGKKIVPAPQPEARDAAEGRG